MYITAMENIKRALKMLMFFTLLVGVLYPALITLIGKICFPYEVNGSLIMADNKIVGSELIGQQFTDPKYFWGRPSATTPMPYNALASGASNLGPANIALQDQVNKRLAALQSANPHANHQVTLDLVTSSGSGLDPDISIRSAYYQVPRIASSRQVNANTIETLILAEARNNYLNIFSMKTVNVVRLNHALDMVELIGKTHDR